MMPFQKVLNHNGYSLMKFKLKLSLPERTKVEVMYLFISNNKTWSDKQNVY